MYIGGIFFPFSNKRPVPLFGTLEYLHRLLQYVVVPILGLVMEAIKVSTHVPYWFSILRIGRVKW
jgi:hypothetical protein